MLERWSEIKSIFREALDASPENRLRVVAVACAHDAQLEQAVRQLIDQAEIAEREAFLEVPPAFETEDLAETLVDQCIGRYRVLALIGRGGMGSVYLAEPLEGLFTGERVALKLIDTDLRDIADFYRRFMEEAKSLVRLRGTAVVTILDSGITSGGLPYIVMEHVDGVSLDDYCDERRLDLRQRIRLFRAVCVAVDEAHSTGIVHRDIKPQHILVTQQETIRLLDFGLAKALSIDAAPDDALQRSQRILTLRYASPEQVQGGPVSAATDVYSLGVVLYELVTGVHIFPFKDLGHQERARHICEVEPRRPSAVIQGRVEVGERQGAEPIPRDFDSIVMAALRKDPAERYQTAGALAEDLDRYLGGDPVRAHRGGPLYKASKFKGRHPIFTTVVATIALLLAVGGCVALWRFDVRERARLLSLQRLDSERLAAAAAELADTDPELALGFALTAIDAAETPAAEDALRLALNTPLQMVLRGHADKVCSATFSPDGKSIATTSEDGFIRLWDAASGKLVWNVLSDAESVRFSSDGSLLEGLSRGRAQVWSVAERELVYRTDEYEHQRNVRSYIPFDHWILRVSRFVYAERPDVTELGPWQLHRAGTIFYNDPDAYQMSLQGRKPDEKTRELFLQITGPITAATVRHDGSALAIGERNGTVRLWNVAVWPPTSKDAPLAATYAFAGHAGAVNDIAFASDGRTLITGGDDATIRIWDVASGRLTVQRRTGANRVLTLNVGSDGRRVIAGTSDGAIVAWDLRSPSSGQGRLSSQPTTAVALSRDGRKIIAGSGQGVVAIYDAVTILPQAALKGHTGRISRVGFSKTGRYAFSQSDDGTGAVWETETGRLVTSVDWAAFGTDLTKAAAWRPVIGRSAGRLLPEHVYGTKIPFKSTTGLDTEPCTQLARPPELIREQGVHKWVQGSRSRGLGLVASSDGAHLAAFTADRAVLWRQGKPWDLLLGDFRSVRAAALNPTEGLLAVGGNDGILRVWQLGESFGGGPFVSFRADRGTVHSVEISPDGRRVITAGDDFTVRVWHLPRPVLPARTAREFAWSIDGRLIGVAEQIPEKGRHVANVYDVDTGRLVAQLNGDGSLLDFEFDPLSRWAIARSGINFRNTIRVWNLHDASTRLNFSGVETTIRSQQFSPDGQWILTTSSRGAQLLKAATGEYAATFDEEGTQGAMFSRDGTKVMLWRDDGVAVWDVASRQPITRVNATRPDADIFARYSPTGEHVVLAEDEMLRVYAVPNGRTVWSAANDGGARILDFSGDGRYVVSGNAAGVVRVRESTSGRTVAVLDVGGAASGLRFSQRGDVMILGAERASGDNAISAWRVGSFKHPVLELNGWHTEVNTDGSFVAIDVGDMIVVYPTQMATDLNSLRAAAHTRAWRRPTAAELRRYVGADLTSVTK